MTSKDNLMYRKDSVKRPFQKL